ncbi:Nucleolar protein 9 [Orbilia brochopaga]|uniref:Nucleolar protein 9 n=1 Tax=Orbilia brochopaga TaxID=3140254 RepID=A0AAV9VIJ4_9PEZI
MPKELKKRGRRAAKRQKLDHDDAGDAGTSTGAAPQGLVLDTQMFVASGETADTAAGAALPFGSGIAAGATFFGLLDEAEAEYFRKADEMLETNQFNSDEEREAFLVNVLKEAENKELKMACSQGCSRLLEKLLFLADAARVKVVFQRFHGHFNHLMSHRFASHCCEALFTAAAAVAAAEYLELNIPDADTSYVSAESLFLYTVAELESSIDSLLMNAFGAHALRTLFLVLAGAPLDSPAYKALVHSRKKEKISAVVEKAGASVKGQARPVPETFREALSKIINAITADIDRTSIRNLATDSLGSPTLQLLIELDLGRSRKYKTRIEQSLVGKLLLLQPGEEERDVDATRSFVKMLLQDKVGSHLLERVMACVPKKTFGQLYDLYFKGQMGKLAASETASYVVVKVLEKLEGQEFKGAVGELKEALPTLLENHQVAVVRAVVDNCGKHGVDADGFCDALFVVWGEGDGQEMLLKMLEVSIGELEKLEADDAPQEKAARNPGQLHASLLVQALLTVPGRCSAKVKDSITLCSGAVIRQLCKHQTASHAIQKSLAADQADVAYKRKLVGLLAGSIAGLAVHPVGSHIVDALWDATASGLKLQRQRIADELVAAERSMRDSFYGRAVWRNWKLDVYKTRRYDWNNLGESGSGEQGEVKKSAIQVASERHAQAAAAKKQKEEESEKAKLKSGTSKKRKPDV